MAQARFNGAAMALVVASLTTIAAQQPAPGGQAPAATPPPQITSTQNNPYRMLENWPDASLNSGAAIGIVPDNKGGVWVHHRSEPPIIHFDAAGKRVISFGDKMFAQAHGFCRDKDGNFWAGDSGPFTDNPAAAAKSFVFYKFSPDGKLLLTLGKPGVSKAGPDTFIMPTSCVALPNGDILIGDGHWPRPSYAQQDGDRLVRYTREGKFVAAYGKLGTGPGEFAGPHSLAVDSQGRIFVADRSNNRVVILSKDMEFIDEWRHFGRPSGVAILKGDVLVVSDSESGSVIDGPSIAMDGGAKARRNPGWQTGVRIGSAKDGSLHSFVPNTAPEGLGVDEQGNIFAGLTGRCQFSKSGGCLQKFVRK